MLFSHAGLTAFINEHFEPTWISVAAVPVITIEFGNGESFQRTLHGNIATYVTLSDGTTTDVIPGIHAVQPYREMLQAALDLTTRIAKLPKGYQPSAIRLHHENQASASSFTATLKENQPGGYQASAPNTDAFFDDPGSSQTRSAPESGTDPPLKTISKGRIEGRLENVLSTRNWTVPSKPTIEEPANEPSLGRPGATQSIDLRLDSINNALFRRPLAHGLLARSNKLDVDSLTKHVYSELLDIDLEDPYMGLGFVLEDGALIELLEKH